MKVTITVTITRAENGYIAEAEGRLHIGATPFDVMRTIIQAISDYIMEETDESGDKFEVNITSDPIISGEKDNG